jgi:hypothetical protein
MILEASDYSGTYPLMLVCAQGAVWTVVCQSQPFVNHLVTYFCS